MTLTYVDVQHTDVRGDALRLVLGATTAPSVASRCVSISDHLVVRLDVLAASHRVAVEVDGRSVLVETVACGDLGRRPVDDSALPASFERVVDGVPYRFTSRLELGDTVVADLAADLRRPTMAPSTLTARFPGHPDAITSLTVCDDGAAVGWETVHLYPGSDAHAVVTTSSIATGGLR